MKKRYPFSLKNWLRSCLALLFAAFFYLNLQAQTGPAKQWDKTFGGSNEDGITSLKQTSDGGYILGGWSSSGISGDKSQASNGFEDYWVVKLDATGNKQWDKTFGGSKGDWLTSLQQTSDGGYILGGYSKSGISGDKSQDSIGYWDYWVVKLDASGNKTWDKTIGGSNYDMLYSLQQTFDGGYILGGTSWSGIGGDKSQASIGPDYWVVKLDALGNITWDKTITGGADDYLSSLQQTSDGGYILGGRSNSGINGVKSQAASKNDYWVLKLDASGNIIWDKTIAGSDYDELYSLQQTSDGGYILGGYSKSEISRDKTQASKGKFDYWVVKLDALGGITWNKTIGGSAYDELYSLQQTSDGGYILGGISRSGISGDKSQAAIGDYDYWVVKVDASGNKTWDKTLGTSIAENFSSLRQTSDGGFILGGNSYSGTNGDKSQASKGGNDFWVVKLAAPAPSVPMDVAVTAFTSANSGCGLSNQETITITVHNLGSTAQSNIPVSYKINNGTPVNEVVPGPLAPNTSVSYSFTTKANLITSGTYNIEAKTNLTGDALPINDTFTKAVIAYAVPAAPTVTTSGATSLCGGGTVTLTAAAATTTTGVSYQWFNNGTSIKGATAATYTANAAGSYTAKAIVAGNCVSPASAATTLTMNTAPPAPTITGSGSLTICSGDSIALTAVSSVSGATFAWFKNGNIIAGATSATYMAQKAGSYTAIALVGGNCSSPASAATTLTVNPTPKAPSINTGGSLALCPGDSVALTAVSSVSGATFTWFKNGNVIAGATATTYTAKTAGNYTVTVTANGCTSTASGAKNVTIKQAPATPTITQAGFVLTSSSSSDNQWYKDNVAIAGANSKKYTTTSNGSYTVVVTDNGCQSAASNAIVISTTGTGADMNGLNVAVYPNPSNGLFSITLPEGGGYQLTVTDLTGKIIKQLTTKDKNTQLNISNVAKGVYFLEIAGEGKTSIRKLVVE